MKYKNAIGTISDALNGTRLCVGTVCLLWATTKNGESFAVAEVIDGNKPDVGYGRDFPFYDINVTDWLGNSHDFTELTSSSQEELCDFVIDKLY